MNKLINFFANIDKETTFNALALLFGSVFIACAFGWQIGAGIGLLAFYLKKPMLDSDWIDLWTEDIEEEENEDA